MPGKRSSRLAAMSCSSGRKSCGASCRAAARRRTGAQAVERHEARQALGDLDARESGAPWSRGRAPRPPATATGSKGTGTGGPGRPPAASAPGTRRAGSTRAPLAWSRRSGSSSRGCGCPCSASAGSRSCVEQLVDRLHLPPHDLADRVSCSRGLSPSALVSTTAASSCSCRPDTRIMKNSSRFEPKMARNFTRSSSGHRGFKASSSTRSLNASHDSSRLM